MKRYSADEVVKALRKEAKKWESYAEKLSEEFKEGLSELEVEENRAEYQNARNWQNSLACVAFEIENGNILE